MGGAKQLDPMARLSGVDQAWIIVMADLKGRLRRAIEHKAELELAIERTQVEMDLISARIKMEEQDDSGASVAIAPEE